jgi:hypothetical protein
MLEVIVAGVSSIRGGQLSITFHVPFEQIDEGSRLHRLHGEQVRLEITPYQA